MMTHIESLADKAREGTSEACAEWGIGIGNQMFRIENAEQLAPPKLEFGGGRELPAEKGSGDRKVQGEFDFRGQSFFKERNIIFDKRISYNKMKLLKSLENSPLTNGQLSVLATRDCSNEILWVSPKL